MEGLAFAAEFTAQKSSCIMVMQELFFFCE
jgi:hypothetical protein